MEESRDATHLLLEASSPHLLKGYHINAVAVPDDFLERDTPQTLNIAIARDGVPIR